nr:PD-(D/E)XK nuclease domain-containing protein [Treponema pedis]
MNGNGNAEQAIKQIKDKDYIGKYSGSGKKISIIGAAFDEEKRTVKNWLSEELNNTD